MDLLGWGVSTFKLFFSWIFCIKCILMAVWITQINNLEGTGMFFGMALPAGGLPNTILLFPARFIQGFVGSMSPMLAQTLHLGFYIAAGEAIVHYTLKYFTPY